MFSICIFYHHRTYFTNGQIRSILLCLPVKETAQCHLAGQHYSLYALESITEAKKCVFSSFSAATKKMPSLVSTLLPMFIVLSIAATGIEIEKNNVVFVCLLLLPSKLLFYFTFALIPFLELLASASNQNVSVKKRILTVALHYIKPSSLLMEVIGRQP